MDSTDQSAKTNMNVSFIKSNKGQPLLVLNSYVFRLNKKRKDKKYWVCSSAGCNVTVHTDLNDEYRCGGTAEHNHEPNPDMVLARQVRQNIKERAVNEVIPIAMIYEQEVSKPSVTTTTVAILPTCQEIGEFCKS